MFDDLVSDLEDAEQHRVVGEFDRRFFEVRLNFSPSVFEQLPVDQASLIEKLPSSSELLVASMAFEHEMIHWYQQIGTAYGYFQLEADECSARLVGTFLEQYRRLHPKAPLPRPIAAWVFRQWPRRRRAYADHVSRGGDLQSYLRSVTIDPFSSAFESMHLNRAIELCEGLDNTSALIAHFLHAQLWIPLRANQVAGDAEIMAELKQRSYLSHLDPEPLDRHRAAVPTVSGYGLLGAWHLMEGQAHAIELLKLSNVLTHGGRKELVEPYVHRSGGLDYRVALNYFTARIGSKASSGNDGIYTFLALCDLAVSTPIHLVFFPLARELKWRDLHPGWRFLDACDVVSEKIGTIGNDSGSLDPTAYTAFIKEVCAYFGWPTPVEMANYFLEPSTAHRSPSLNTTFFAAACELRSELPTAFVLYLYDDNVRVSKLIETMPRPPVVLGPPDNRLTHLPDWRGLEESQRWAFARDLFRAAGVYRVADFLLHSTDEFDALDGYYIYNDIDDLLRATWNVSTSDFRLIQ